jgi:sulfur-oxidizing protein SoxZ
MVARVSLPQSAKKGEVITVRVAIQHPMETGFRFDANGAAITKNVINRLVCRYNGVEVFSAELGSGIAANPHLEFHTIATASGKLEVEWADDAGVRSSEVATVSVG